MIATDGDGTLWSGDVGEDLFDAFLAHGRVEPPARDAIFREAREFCIDTTGSAATVARRIGELAMAGAYPEERFYEMNAWCFAGWSRVDVVTFAREVVAARRLASRLHAELARVLDGARACGVDVVIVSASPRAIVEVAAEVVGVDVANVVALSPRWEGDTMLPDVERPIPYGPGKVDGLRAKIGARPVYAAFGDSPFDLAMLADAELAIAVRPKPKLRARASELPGLRELAVDL